MKQLASYERWSFMQIISLLIGSVMIANFVLAFTIIFLERKNASTTWAWLMVLFFIPVLGFILYLIFGKRLTGQIFTWDTKSRLGVEKQVQKQLEILENDRIPYKQDVLKQYKELYYLHLKHNDALYSQNNKVDLFTDGTEKFSALIRDLEQARIIFICFIILYVMIN